MNQIHYILLLALATVLAACAGKPRSEISTTTSMQQEEYLNPSEPIHALLGNSFAIRIRSNPTTGYGWQLANQPDASIIRLITNQFLPPASKLLGAGGHEIWTFQAIGRGRTQINMQYIRSWETQLPPARQASFIIIVD